MATIKKATAFLTANELNESFIKLMFVIGVINGRNATNDAG